MNLSDEHPLRPRELHEMYGGPGSSGPSGGSYTEYECDWDCDMVNYNPIESKEEVKKLKKGCSVSATLLLLLLLSILWAIF